MKTGTRHKAMRLSMAILFTGVTALSVRKRIRDKKTELLLGVITSKIGSGVKLLDAEKAFDVNYLNKLLQQVTFKVLVIKKEVASSYAQQIHSAWASWYQGGDNEAKVYAVFRTLQDKVQVAQVSKAYQDLYSENLIDVIKERFSNSEIKEVLGIVARLPNYRTTNT